MGMWSPIVGAGVAAAGELFSGKSANKASKQSAREQMRFQEHLSNTAHQREVADLKAAGLNPILSANSGASTPSGASYTAAPVDVGGAAVRGYESGASSAKTVATTKPEVNQMKAAAEAALASGRANDAAAERTAQEIRINRYMLPIQLRQAEAQVSATNNNSALTASQIGKTQMEKTLMDIEKQKEAATMGVYNAVESFASPVGEAISSGVKNQTNSAKQYYNSIVDGVSRMPDSTVPRLWDEAKALGRKGLEGVKNAHLRLHAKVNNDIYHKFQKRGRR